jgi:ABC-type lipoprotein export system ATPase subunit
MRAESGTTLVMVTHDEHVATRDERVLEKREQPRQKRGEPRGYNPTASKDVFPRA